MTHRLIVAHDDYLTRPETTVEYGAGEFLAPRDGCLTDDLGVATVLQIAGGTFHFRFRRPLSIGVVGVLNTRVTGTALPSFASFTVQVTAFLGATSVGSQTLGFSTRPRSPFDLDRYWIPAAPVLATSLQISAGAASPIMIGRLFASLGQSFDGGTAGNLDAGWTMAPTDQFETPIGIAGGARPQPSVTGRRVAFGISGMPDSAALYGTQSDRYGLARADPTAGLADLQARIGSSRPLLALLRANGAGADVYTYAAYGRLTDPVTITRARDGGPWSARFVVQETQR